MGKNQIIVLLSGAILVLLFYIFGNRTDHSTPAHNHDHTSGETNAGAAQGPMMGGANVEAIKFETLYQAGIKNLSAAAKKENEALVKQLESSDTPINCANLAEFWEKQKDLNIAAHYYKKGALLENKEKSITFAADLFSTLMVRTENKEIKKWQALEAAQCYEKVLAMNPDNLDAKTALANCYTEGTGETMKGVLMLKEVTKKDSTNLGANLILGKLSVQSGQYEKAIKRMNVVLSQQPKNTEAMYFLAEAYKGQGNKDKAIELFEQFKSVVNNPKVSEEVDNYINSFK